MDIRGGGHNIINISHRVPYNKPKNVAGGRYQKWEHYFLPTQNGVCSTSKLTMFRSSNANPYMAAIELRMSQEWTKFQMGALVLFFYFVPAKILLFVPWNCMFMLSTIHKTWVCQQMVSVPSQKWQCYNPQMANPFMAAIELRVSIDAIFLLSGFSGPVFLFRDRKNTAIGATSYK